MNTLLEINSYYELEMPKDSSNKKAASLHYYFPSQTEIDDEITPIS